MCIESLILGMLYSKHSCSPPVAGGDFSEREMLPLRSPAEFLLAGRKEYRKSAKSEVRLLMTCEYPVAESDTENF